MKLVVVALLILESVPQAIGCHKQEAPADLLKQRRLPKQAGLRGGHRMRHTPDEGGVFTKRRLQLSFGFDDKNIAVPDPPRQDDFRSRQRHKQGGAVAPPMRSG